jgi:hypothetical protein
LRRRIAAGRALPQGKCQQEHVTRHRATTPRLGQGDQACPRGGVSILRSADSHALGDAARLARAAPRAMTHRTTLRASRVFPGAAAPWGRPKLSPGRPLPAIGRPSPAMGARMAGAALSLSVRAWYETSYAYLGRRIQRCSVRGKVTVQVGARGTPRHHPRTPSPRAERGLGGEDRDARLPLTVPLSPSPLAERGRIRGRTVPHLNGYVGRLRGGRPRSSGRGHSAFRSILQVARGSDPSRDGYGAASARGNHSLAAP